MVKKENKPCKALIVLALSLLTTVGAWADTINPVSLSEDDDFTVDEVGHYYVNMPETGTSVLTLSDGSISTFKVYDNGGKKGKYTYNCKGYLIINAPAGYFIELTGTVKTEGVIFDWLTVYDGITNEVIGENKYYTDGSKWKDIGTLKASENSLKLYFESDHAGLYDGLDLTVRLFSPYELYGFVGLQDSYSYTGNVIEPIFDVVNAGKIELTKDVDYTLTITPWPVQNVGEYTVTAQGKGDCSGTLSKQITVVNGLVGSGTKEDPYTIGSEYEWSCFATLINDPDSNSIYNNKYYKLVNDITVSTMVGISQETLFRGRFDGDNHTMTLNLNATEDYCAPFRYVIGGTFKRLHVAGTINTNGYRYAGGLIACTKRDSYTTYIDNCWSSVTFNCTVAKDDNYDRCYGGFVGYAGKYVEISNSLFDGSFIGTDCKGCSGFVGEQYESGYYELGIEKCLFAPSQVPVGDRSNYTFAKDRVGGIGTSYYTQPFGVEQGSAVGSMTNAELKEALGSSWVIKNNKVIPVMDNRNFENYTITCSTAFIWTGSKIRVVPVIKDMDGMEVDAYNYNVSISPSPVLEAGTYTMTVTGKASRGYSGTLSHEFKVVKQLQGEGTQSNPYTISSTADWNSFADIVNGGEQYWNKYVALENDIEISTMVGLDSDHKFEGKFDGRGHKLTANIVSNDPAFEGAAPFHYTYGANFYNLTVDGTITSAGRYAGGLIGWSGNGDECENCVVKATIITGADYAGGFIGNIEGVSNGNVSFKDCVFAGTIQSIDSKQHKVGGFVGYGMGSTYMTSCLENGTYTNISLMNPRTGENSIFSGNKNVTSLYYVNRIGYMDDFFNESNNYFKVFLTAPENAVYQPKTIQGYTFYLPVTTGFMDSYLYDDGQAVNLINNLKAGTATLTENTDYTVTIKDSNNETVAKENLTAVGNYTITFTPVPGNEAGYAGQASYAFSIVDNARSLDDYVFAYDDVNDVYVINNEADLERLAAYVNSGHNAQNMTFSLGGDITMESEHTPIGLDNKNPFRGTFDGKNNKIIGLTVNKPGDRYIGLFGYLGLGAQISNVILQGCDITGADNVGGIMGYTKSNGNNQVKIENCHVSGTVKSTKKGGSYIGGIAGYCSYGDIIGCTVSGSVYTTCEAEYIGGIAGSISNGKIESSENAAAISGDGERHGGITGAVDNQLVTITDCLNTGAVEGTGSIGGIAGYYSTQTDQSGIYTRCYYVAPGDGSAYRAALQDDVAGKAERVYSITKAANFSGVTIVSDGAAVTSMIDGKKYMKSGNWTVTLTPSVPDGYSFVNYICQGGTLTDVDQEDGNHTLTVNNQNLTFSVATSRNGAIDMNLVAVADIDNQLWLGNVELRPAVVVTYNDATLVEGTDFYLKYSDNIDKGTATITLKGLNDYEGTITKTFNIVDLPLLNPGEDNSENNPYLISSEAELKALAFIVNSGKRTDGYYRQNAPITLTTEHIVIGDHSDHGFEGYYDGYDNPIRNLVINRPTSQFQGLFGVVGGVKAAVITRVILENCDITGGSYTGGIAAELFDHRGVISNCKVSGAIKADNDIPIPVNYHGGILGYCGYSWSTGQTIENCINSAMITGKASYCGGIVGYTQSRTTVRNCLNTGVVEGYEGVGSIVGRNNGSISNNYHTPGTTGGVGGNNNEGIDRSGAEVIVRITADEGVSITYPSNPTLILNEENYYKSGTSVTLEYALPDGKYFVAYSVNSGNISNSIEMQGSHVLTGFNQDVVISGSFVDNLTDIAAATVMSIDDLTFNGRVQNPLPVVKLGDDTLVLNYDYTLSYSTDCINVGEKAITITGVSRYFGTNSQVFNINPFDFSGEDALTISDMAESYALTGDVLPPVPTVKCLDTDYATLIKDTDFLLSCSGDCMLPGDYTITLTGQGNYTGSRVIPFTIVDIASLTVNDGTRTEYYVPVYGRYVYQYTKSEFVMPAAELTAMNGKVIRNIRFHIQQTASGWGNARFRVFMKEVDFTTFDSNSPAFSGTDNATIVYEGALDGTKYVMNIDLSTPYMYKGGNLLIGIYEYEKGTAGYAFFYGETVNGASVYGSNSNSLNNVLPNRISFQPKTTFWYDNYDLVLDNDDSQVDDSEKNTAKISDFNDKTVDVILKDRVLYKNGEWNTLCLPFDVSTTDGPLSGDGVEVQILNTESSNLSETVLTLNFDKETTGTIAAGTPFIIKWTKPDGYDTDPDAFNIVDPEFKNVTITSQAPTAQEFEGGSFVGQYSSFKVGDKASGDDGNLDEIIVLGSGNVIGYYNTAKSLRTFRAHFEIPVQLGQKAATRGVVNFADGTTTDVILIPSTDSKSDWQEGEWYTPGGIQLEGRPTESGEYINNGRTIVIF